MKKLISAVFVLLCGGFWAFAQGRVDASQPAEGPLPTVHMAGVIAGYSMGDPVLLDSENNLTGQFGYSVQAFYERGEHFKLKLEGGVSQVSLTRGEEQVASGFCPTVSLLGGIRFNLIEPKTSIKLYLGGGAYQAPELGFKFRVIADFGVAHYLTPFLALVGSVRSYTYGTERNAPSTSAAMVGLSYQLH